MNTNRDTITTMGIISNEVYNDNKSIVDYFKDEYDTNGNKIIKFIRGTTYKVLDHTDNWTINGFEALLLEENIKLSDGTFKKTGKYVVAFRGTDSILDGIEDITTIPLANFNPQYSSAIKFVNKALARKEITKDNLTLTGHSLGGILTQQVGATLKIKGYAFNPWGSDALVKYPPNNIFGILSRVLDAVGIIDLNSSVNWAKDNILNISYQDAGTINGDILSNFLTGIISEHLGGIVPIWGVNRGLEGHRMPHLNTAIKEANDILSHFSKNTTYLDLAKAYTLSSIGGKDGYQKNKKIFNELDIYNSNNLTFNFLSNKSISQLNQSSKPNLYALINLNPFTIEGNLPAYSDIDVKEYSDMFIKKRAEFLENDDFREVAWW